MNIGDLQVGSGRLGVLDNWSGDRLQVVSCPNGGYSVEIDVNAASESVVQRLQLVLPEPASNVVPGTVRVGVDSGFLIVGDEEFIRTWDPASIEELVLQMMESDPEESHVGCFQAAAFVEA